MRAANVGFQASHSTMSPLVRPFSPRRYGDDAGWGDRYRSRFRWRTGTGSRPGTIGPAAFGSVPSPSTASSRRPTGIVSSRNAKTSSGTATPRGGKQPNRMSSCLSSNRMSANGALRHFRLRNVVNTVPSATPEPEQSSTAELSGR